MKRQGKITVTYPGGPVIPPPGHRLDLAAGWTEVWEHGRYLGLFERLHSLEAFIAARPTRCFVIRFMSPGYEGDRFLGVFPVGSFAAEASADRVRYFPLDQMRQRVKEGRKS